MQYYSWIVDGSGGFDEFVELLNVEIEHLIGDTFDMVLLEFKFDPQKADFFLRKMDQLL